MSGEHFQVTLTDIVCWSQIRLDTSSVINQRKVHKKTADGWGGNPRQGIQ